MTDAVRNCTNCPNKERGACLPFSAGVGKKTLAIVGSHPSKAETNSQTVFTGESGGLLRKILEQLQISPEDCYFTYAVKCDQPLSKEPDISKKLGKAMMSACQPTLMGELFKVKPDYIITLGRLATTAVLGPGRPITRRRGLMERIKIFGMHECVVLPTLNIKTVAAVPEYYPDLMTDLLNLQEVMEGREIQIEPPYADYRVVNNEKSFDVLLEKLNALPSDQLVAMDLETSGLNMRVDRILCYGLCWTPGKSVIIDWEKVLAGRPDQIARLSAAVNRIRGVFHNGSFDAAWLWHVGVDVNFYVDSMLAHYTVDERKGTHGLERLAIDRYAAPPYEFALKKKFKLPGSGAEQENTSYEVVPKKDLFLYNGADCDYTLRLINDLMVEMEEDGQLELMFTHIMPSAYHFMRLENDGMLVDEPYLDDIGAKWEKELEEYDQQLRDILSQYGKEDINLNSRQQLADFMFQTLGLKQMPSANPEDFIPLEVILELTQQVDDEEAEDYFKTASSATFSKLKSDSTAAYMLWWLAQQHDFPRILVKRRDTSTMHKNYFKGTKLRMDVEKRIRPQYKVHGTVTGRLSSTNPNIHGMPRKEVIKDIYTADPGWILIAADYSQAEVRMLAHLAKDAKLIQALNAGDIHANIAAMLFNMSLEDFMKLPKDVIKFRRRAAKTIVFGRIYGRGDKSMAPQIGATVKETKKFTEAFDESMPNSRKWIDKQKQLVIQNQEATSIYGRKRRFPLIMRANKAEAERQGVNFPIQGSVSDMTLKANMRIIRVLEEESIPCKVWPHIHDGFLFQVPVQHKERAIEITIEAMQRPDFVTDVHFAVEVEAGPKWGQMKKVYEG